MLIFVAFLLYFCVGNLLSFQKTLIIVDDFEYGHKIGLSVKIKLITKLYPMERTQVPLITVLGIFKIASRLRHLHIFVWQWLDI